MVCKRKLSSKVSEDSAPYLGLILKMAGAPAAPDLIKLTNSISKKKAFYVKAANFAQKTAFKSCSIARIRRNGERF